MTNEQIENLKTRLVVALMVESRDVWEAGLQNCAGPISMSDAEAIVSDIFDSVLQEETD